jgi:hypothetical protein
MPICHLNAAKEESEDSFLAREAAATAGMKPGEHSRKSPIEIAFEEFRVDVILPADRFRVVEFGCHCRNRLVQDSLSPCRPFFVARSEEQPGGQGRSLPSSKVLRREVMAGSFEEIRVYGHGIGGNNVPVGIAILERMRARQSPELTKQPYQPAIGDIDLAMNARFTAKAQVGDSATELHMPIAKRGKSIRVIRAHILFVTNSNRCEIEQCHHSGKDACGGHFIAAEIACDATAKFGQQLRACFQPPKLGRIGDCPPSLMVEILFAAAGIVARCLKVAIGRRADPHVVPSRWNCQSFDSRKVLAISQTPAAEVEIDESMAIYGARKTSFLVKYVSQICKSGKFLGS